MRLKCIGKKDFHGSVDITDPGYEKDIWCRRNSVKIKDGVFACYVWIDGRKGIDARVARIAIYADDSLYPPFEKDMEKFAFVGVDSGMAGFFHDKPDYTSEQWDRFNDKLNWSKYPQAWLWKDGFFSESGWGDGSYPVYKHVDIDGDIDALEIAFM